jgi:hypothetical protein
MTSIKRIPLLLALAACMAAAGCGSDDGKQMPADSVASLERQLDSIQNRFDVGGGACGDISGGADSNTAAVEKTIESLPDDVDAEVRDAVQESFDRLFEIVDEQCQAEETPPATEPVEPAPEPTTTVPPATETQETTPPQTEPETQPTTPQQPPQTTPSEGGGGANGGGRTNGGAGGGSGTSGQGGEGNGGGDTGSSGGGALVPEGTG